MTQITKEHLDFMDEARYAFLYNPRLETFRNEDNTLIALRRGFDRDCIEIHKLDGRVATFVQQMPPVAHPGTEICK